MTAHFDYDHAVPTVEGVKARLVAVPFEPESVELAARKPSPITVLLNMLEQRDKRAAEHAFRVAELASKIAIRVELSPVQVARLRLASLLHDIGKLSVPAEVLHKPGPLDDDEWARVKSHPEYAFQMIASSVHPDVAETVLKHCERLDGKGYPNGSDASEIPLLARVLLVADAYDAMRSPRPYRLPLDPWEAISNLREGAGTQFDPAVVDALHDLALEEAWIAA
jgi:HD-GYP domain-containing protein (c-di-GMP phosphodiesterase class II)